MTARLRDCTADELARLQSLAAISQVITATGEVEDVLQRVMDAVMKALEAERGFILLDRGGRDVDVVIRRGLEVDVQSDAGLEFSRSVVRYVLESGEPVLCHDAVNDPRFVASTSLRMLGTRSILCVPIARPGVPPLGVIYVDSRTTTDIFNEVDRDLLAMIAGLAHGALERAHDLSVVIQSEKMATLGTLVAGLAHELNNPLTTIIGVAELLQDQSVGSEQREMAALIHQESLRCHELVSALLRSARRGRVTMESVDVAEVLHRAVRLMTPQKEGARVPAVVLEIPPGLPPLRGNAHQLLQVFLNLLTNGYQAASAEGGRIRLKAFQSPRGIRIVVADNGPGIPAAHLRRIFEPFFTTRPAGEGTGLGLTIAQRIVLDHGGTLRAHNEEDGGAVFTIELPVQS